MKLSGQTILITGGTSGIGLEFAKVLLAKQNKVIITGRSADRLQKVKTMLPGIETIASDVAKEADIRELVSKVRAQFPQLNILINNAGIMNELNLNREDLTDKDLSAEIETNLMGPIRLSQSLLPQLKQQQEAAIVNVSSGLAFVPLPTAPIYSATKAALHSFTMSLRVQLQKTQIKVFEVAPPATVTPLLDGHNMDDMKGIKLMPVEEMVRVSVAGIEGDLMEIRPGASNQLKLMSRIAPDFIFKQLSKPVERMLSSTKR